MLAGGNLAIANAAIDNRAGAQLLAGADMALTTGSLTNSAATIHSGRDLRIRAARIGNQAAAPTVRTSTYFVDTGAGYQDDKWLTLGAYLADLPSLVADELARAKLTYPESSADHVDYRGSHRLKLYGPGDFDMDSGLGHVRFDFTRSAYEQPAILSAGRNLDIAASGALESTASLINAGAAATIRAASLSNAAAQNAYTLFIEGGEWSRYTVYAPAAAALQAGTRLSVEVGGSVVNTGNVLGTQIALSGGEITNGITSTIPTIGSSLPAAVIPLLPPGLGAANEAHGTLTGALGQGIAGAPGPGGPTLGAVSAPTLASLGAGTHGAAGVIGKTEGPLLGSVQVSRSDYGRWGTPGITGETVQAPGASPIAGYLKSEPGTQPLAPLTPDYLIALLPEPLVKGANLFFYADPFVEAQLLQQAALREVGQAFFVNGLAYDDQHKVSIDTQQRAILYDNAAAFAKDNGLRLGVALSPELQAKLDKPLLWYVEQEVPDGGGARALVPTVYLPALYRQTHLNVAGGLIRGEEVSLSAGTLTNTGSIVAANTLSIDAQQFINARRQADIGKRWQGIEGGWIDITGTQAVEDGAFIAAANLQLNAQRIESISGELQILGDNAADTQAKSAAYLEQLRTRLGANFVESQAQDNLHVEVHQDQGLGLEQIAVMAVGIALSFWLGPQMSAMLSAPAESAAAAAITEGLVQGTITSAAEAAAVQTAVYSTFTFAPGTVATAAVSGALTGVATSATTQLLATGSIDGNQLLSAAVSGGFSGGLNQFYGNTWTPTRVLADATVSGAAETIGGGKFENGFRNGLIVSGFAWAAAEMRKQVIEQSKQFNGIVDEEGSIFDNISGPSVDGQPKTGGERLDLDTICRFGKCSDQRDGTVLFERFMDGPDLRTVIAEHNSGSVFGARQGGPGALFGMPYSPGSFAHRIVETFGGPHDWLNDIWSYNHANDPARLQFIGNIRTNMNALERMLSSVMNYVDIPLSAPFALSTLASQFGTHVLGPIPEKDAPPPPSLPPRSLPRQLYEIERP